MTADPQPIWHYFQNERLDAFQASKPRLDFLIVQVVLRFAGSPRVVNIGAGDGYFEHEAQRRGWQIESVDPDAHAIARLALSGITGHVSGIESLPMQDSSVDCVVISEVLEHLTDAQSVAGIAEIARVLKPGGYMIGTVPHAENLIEQQAVCPKCAEVFHRWGHQRSLTMDDVGNMLRGFTIEALERTAFVALRGRGVKGFIKGLARIALAKAGAPIAIPTIWWVARK